MSKLNPKVKKTLKYFFITLGVILLLFITLIVYLVCKDLKQESILEQEIITYSNKNLATDDYTIEIKTTGDYAHVETAVKRYYKELSDCVKNVNSYLNSDKLLNMLSIENLITDRPDFTLSHSTIKITKEKIMDSINKIKTLCEEKTIKQLLDKEKLFDEEYYYDLYLQYMYTESDKVDLDNLKKEMVNISTNINNCLDKMDEILLFLQSHDSEIEYSSSNAYFNSDASYTEYKKLLSELNELASKITVESNSSTKPSEL